jgi:hypothetical protein
MAALALAGCSETSSATPFAGACTPMEVVSWSPADDANGIPVDTTIVLGFTDYPDPDTLSTRTLLLTTGPYYVPGRYVVDFLDKTVTLTPWRWLASKLGYTVQVFPGLRSLSGCDLRHDSRAFKTGDGPAPPPSQDPDQPPALPPVAFADVQAIFSARCAGSGCHLSAQANDGGSDGGGHGDCLATPAQGLSLCASESWASLVNVSSRQLSALPLVAPGNAARSYLFRKLVPSDAPDGAGGPLPGTLGQREPPGPPLPEEQLRVIARWIDEGALQ